MRGLPLLIPLAFVTFIALGLAQPKTMVVGTAFALAIVLGIYRGNRINWLDGGLKLEDRHVIIAFWGAVGIIALQLFLLRDVPLLHPAIRTQLNPRLTALTYFLGVPSSVYLFLRGKRYSLLYPLAVSLYAYRTPVLVSLVAIGSAYCGNLRAGNRSRITGVALLMAFLGLLGIGMTLARGEALSNLWVRIQSSTSVLDIIVWRAGWKGFYHGYLQWSGLKSYITGGYSPRGLVAKFLYVRTGSTITPTLLGGMYLDFGIFALLEGFLLGMYYGMISRATHPVTLSLYYSTLAYGLIGVETGILDLPVYLLFGLGAYVVLSGWKKLKHGVDNAD